MVLIASVILLLLILNNMSTLPEMQLVLVGLGHSSQTVQMTEQLDSVVRLDVMHPVAEHLQ